MRVAASLLEAAEEDLLAFYAFAPEHWTKLRSTNPLERVNKELSTEMWCSVMRQAGEMGILQVHLSGGEPTARKAGPGEPRWSGSAWRSGVFSRSCR